MMSPAQTQSDVSSTIKKANNSKSAEILEASGSEKDIEGNETENEEKLEIDENKENSENANASGTPSNKKRSSSSSESTSSSKKVRSKPKPQVIDNMKEYVDSNTTDKLTTTTLRHWLKERSLHCTTREKKADLIEKVCKHILSTNNS